MGRGKPTKQGRRASIIRQHQEREGAREGRRGQEWRKQHGPGRWVHAALAVSRGGVSLTRRRIPQCRNAKHQDYTRNKVERANPTQGRSLCCHEMKCRKEAGRNDTPDHRAWQPGRRKKQPDTRKEEPARSQVTLQDQKAPKEQPKGGGQGTRGSAAREKEEAKQAMSQRHKRRGRPTTKREYRCSNGGANQWALTKEQNGETKSSGTG